MLSSSSSPATCLRPLSSSPASPPPAPLQTSALLAVAAGNPRLVSALLATGADPNAHGDAYCYTLALANAFSSAGAIVALDASARVDPAAPDLPFHAAAASARTDLISLARSCPDLAQAGAAAPDGWMPVHAATAAGNLEAVCLCITSGGGDPERADSRGALHYAAASRYLDVTEFLIGWSTYDAWLARTRDGRKTPFDLAVDGGHTDLYDAHGLEGGMSNCHPILVEEAVGGGAGGEVGDDSGADRWVGESI